MITRLVIQGERRCSTCRRAISREATRRYRARKAEDDAARAKTG